MTKEEIFVPEEITCPKGTMVTIIHYPSNPDVGTRDRLVLLDSELRNKGRLFKYVRPNPNNMVKELFVKDVCQVSCPIKGCRKLPEEYIENQNGLLNGISSIPKRTRRLIEKLNN